MDEQYTESRLREELRHAVDHVQVPSDMWSRIRRRHRREPRQRMFAVATSIALLAIVVAAAFPVVRDAAERTQERLGGPGTSLSATPQPTPLPPGTPGEPPEQWDRSKLGPGASNPPGPPVVLSQGAVSGRDWTLVAYPMGDEGVCFGFLETPDLVPGVGWCADTSSAAVSPPRLYPASDSRAPAIVTGFVHRDATQVRLTYPNDGPRYLRSEDDGFFQRDGLPVDFYLDLIPAASTVEAASIEVHAYDITARQLGAGPTTTTVEGPELMPLPGEPVPPGDELSMAFNSATQPGVLLTANYLDNRGWMLVFFQRDAMMCFGWLHGLGSCYGESGTAEPLDGSAIVISGFGGDADGSQIYGVVSKDVTRVRLALPDAGGRVIDLRPVGQEMGLDVNFFGTVLPGGTSFRDARVAAYDEADRQLGSDTAAG